MNTYTITVSCLYTNEVLHEISVLDCDDIPLPSDIPSEVDLAVLNYLMWTLSHTPYVCGSRRYTLQSQQFKKAA